MMNAEEISKIKEHIEIHAGREPRAIRITAILRKAVAELERMDELEKENEELKKVVEHQQGTNMDRYFRNKALDAQLTRAKGLLQDFLLIAKVEQLRDRYESVSETAQFLGEALEC